MAQRDVERITEDAGARAEVATGRTEGMRAETGHVVNERDLEFDDEVPSARLTGNVRQVVIDDEHRGGVVETVLTWVPREGQPPGLLVFSGDPQAADTDVVRQYVDQLRMALSRDAVKATADARREGAPLGDEPKPAPEPDPRRAEAARRVREMRERLRATRHLLPKGI